LKWACETEISSLAYPDDFGEILLIPKYLSLRHMDVQCAKGETGAFKLAGGHHGKRKERSCLSRAGRRGDKVLTSGKSDRGPSGEHVLV
jgi:hypothetical protein